MTPDPYYTVYEIECETPKHRYVGFTQFYSTVSGYASFPIRNVFTTRHGVKRVRELMQVPTEEEAKRAKRERNRALRYFRFTTAM